jgi:glyoxylase-like metal-dependent hydrolase (beta-lactamase superfamily II)/rhodanese-related sulfurtransferase
VIFRQLIHDDLGCASYLVGDESEGTAAVIDPRLEIDEYLELARYFGVSIDHILETHTHADHVSGHGRLAEATGAPIYIHREAGAEYEHVAIDDGFELEVGRITIRALHTPGHRPEHTAFLLIDRGRGADPWAVLTGDTLFVNDVARPDLAIEKREGARGIFRSLREKLLALPDDCEVWPGHLGGSMCGGPGMDMKISSTIGFERAHNPTLAITDENEFVDEAIAALGPQPPNFRRIVEINRGPLASIATTVPPLAPRLVERKQQRGALIVDARTDQQFDDAHIPGAVSISMLRAGFGSRLAWLVSADRETVVVGRDDNDGREAARLADAVGVTNLAGYLAGGMTSWRQEGLPIERIERLALELLPERIERDDVQVVDVRERSEWNDGHIPGSVHAPWHSIDRVPAGIDPKRPIAVVCGSGERAAVGASLVQSQGAAEVIHVIDGGVPKWGRLGNPIDGPS